MWYQSLRSRSSGSERNEQMIVSHRRAAPPINPSLGHFLLGNIANAGLDYSSSNFKDQQDHGTENPNLSSTTRRLPASRVFPHLPNGPGRIRSQARSCISACHGQLLHPTPPPRRPCDQHRLTTGRVVAASQREHAAQVVCPASESYHPAPLGHRVRQYRGSISDWGTGGTELRDRASR